MNNWRKIESALPDTMVEVCGDSGYVMTCRWYIINAYFSRSAKAWLDATGTRLSETWGEPLYWRRMSSFPKADPRG